MPAQPRTVLRRSLAFCHRFYGLTGILDRSHAGLTDETERLGDLAAEVDEFFKGTTARAWALRNRVLDEYQQSWAAQPRPEPEELRALMGLDAALKELDQVAYDWLMTLNVRPTAIVDGWGHIDHRLRVHVVYGDHLRSEPDRGTTLGCQFPGFKVRWPRCHPVTERPLFSMQTYEDALEVPQGRAWAEGVSSDILRCLLPAIPEMALLAREPFRLNLRARSETLTFFVRPV